MKYDGATASVKTDDSNELEKAESAAAIKYLQNAEFKLTLNGDEVKVKLYDDGYYYPATDGTAVITSNADGKIIIRGLDVDSTKAYKLVETKAPDGYNLLTAPADLVIAANNTTADGKPLANVPETSLTKIANNQGSVLPSTGGIGTTIFYIVGAILVIGAGVLLVTRRRMNNNK